MKINEILSAVRGGKKADPAPKPELRVVYALEALRQSIFLAGPTPRSSEVESWRPHAIERLRFFGFTGDVYIPEAHDWQPHTEYDAQVFWEWEAIKQSSVVVFWVPRDIATMPAFTTNVEFGYLVSSGKVILGAPDDAPKMSYLRALAKEHGVPCYSSLDETLLAAVTRNDEIRSRTTRAPSV